MKQNQLVVLRARLKRLLKTSTDAEEHAHFEDELRVVEGMLIDKGVKLRPTKAKKAKLPKVCRFQRIPLTAAYSTFKRDNDELRHYKVPMRPALSQEPTARALEWRGPTAPPGYGRIPAGDLVQAGDLVLGTDNVWRPAKGVGLPYKPAMGSRPTVRKG